MKKLFLVISILMANTSFVQASPRDGEIGRDKNVIVCYFNQFKQVYHNTKSIWYNDSGSTIIDFHDGGRLIFSGVYSCMQAKTNDDFVDHINRNYGTKTRVPGLDR